MFFATMTLPIIILASWMMKLSVAVFAKLRRIFPGGSNSSNTKHSINDENDPFKILGLNREDNPTIEDATKAQRKLALKWHPDRNIDNAEESTIKMQIINNAFNQVENMLAEDVDDVDRIGEQSDTSGEDEAKKNMSKSAKRRAKQKEKKQRYNEEREFERKMKDEFAKFERAQRNAVRGVFSDSPKEQKMGFKGKGKSRAARKKAKKRAKNNNMRCRTSEDENNLSSNDNAANTAKSIPFHQLAPERRCEIKFKSKALIRSPIFTAIRARTYNVLHVTTKLVNPVGRVFLASGDEKENDIGFVTPLMVASYLGDYTAADIIIRNAEDQWADMVLAKSRPGGFSCLSLAMDAKDISQQLCDESKAHLENATKLEDQDVQEKIIEQYSESLEMAKKLVERLVSMEQFAFWKRRGRKRFISWSRFWLLDWLSSFVISVGVLFWQVSVSAPSY